MTVVVSGDSITFNDQSVQKTSPTGFGFKNRLINGDMRIDQRNSGAAVTANNAVFGIDRWKFQASQTAKGTLQQSSTAPSGFSNSLLLTSSSAYSITTTDFFVHTQNIEGYNTADLAWGTANAIAVTLSFWVRSSLTGTFGGALQNNAQDQNYPFSYTISAANTWEQKNITIAGPTAGTWLVTNGRGVNLQFGLGVGATYSGAAGAWTASNVFSATGATSVVGTSGATFYITGVQLEKGSTATSFDYRDYGRELIMCQRYYYVLANGTNQPLGIGAAYTATSVYLVAPFKVSMRAAPTMMATSGTNYYVFYRNAAADNFDSLTLEVASTDSVELSNTANLSGTVGHSGMVRTSNSAAAVAFSAEL